MKKVLVILLSLVTLTVFCQREDEELAERVKPPVDQAQEIETADDEGVKEAPKVPTETADEDSGKEQQKDIVSDKQDTETPVMAETLPDKPNTDGKTEAELWDGYNGAKAKVKEARDQNDFRGSVEGLIEAAAYAESLGRNDIAIWQYNNIGYYAIGEFKRLTDYQSRMDTLQSLSPGEEKGLILSETKLLFNQHMHLLTEGLIYLEEAEQMEQAIGNAQRKAKIESNIRFIKWVREFSKETS